jgi:hypothetical protein
MGMSLDQYARIWAEDLPDRDHLDLDELTAATQEPRHRRRLPHLTGIPKVLSRARTLVSTDRRPTHHRKDC